MNRSLKKTVAIILAMLIALSLAACGGTPAASPSPSAAPSSAAPASAEPSAAPATEAPATEAPAINLANIGEHTFILAHGLPAQSMTGQQYHAFAEAVKEISGGKMVIDEKVGGTLLTDPETLDAVMDGTVDFIHSMGSYVTGTIPNVAPVCVYGYFVGDSDAWFGFADAVRPVMSEIYGEFGIHFVGSLYQGVSGIVCTDKQIKAPADMKGLSFRASGTWISKSIESWGAAPTTIALPDLTTALERKTVQGTATGFNIIVPFKLFEVAKNITITSINEGYAACLMNAKTWDSLNTDEQAVITAAGKVFEQKSVEIGNASVAQYQQAVKDAGCNVYELTADEQKAFVDLSLKVMDEVKTQVTEPGLELISILDSLRSAG
jgi:TRAP-type C4-dicarboxylate transport system substrate-binding protein